MNMSAAVMSTGIITSIIMSITMTMNTTTTSTRCVASWCSSL